MNEFTPLLQTLATEDVQISGKWIIAVIGAIGATATGILGKIYGEKKAQRVRVEEPVPVVPTKKVATPPTWSDHTALEKRVAKLEADTLRVQEEIKEEQKRSTELYRKLLEAGSERERAITKALNAGLANIQKQMSEDIREVHKRLDDHLSNK